MLTYKKVLILIICTFLILTKSTAQSHIIFSGSLERNVFKEILEKKWVDTLGFMLSVDPTVDTILLEAVQVRLNEFVTPFLEKRKNNRNKKATIKKLSRKLGDKYLVHYSKFSNFYQTVSIGRYDCLTSTILYAYFLEKLQIDYSIWETNYHIYIIVHLPKEDILIEPTDPNYGVIVGEENIKTRIHAYKKGNEKRVDTFLANFRIQRKVNFQQLLALQYYNKAVNQFNQQDFNGAIDSIKKSIIVYDCDRNRGFINYSKQFVVKEQTFK